MLSPKPPPLWHTASDALALCWDEYKGMSSPPGRAFIKGYYEDLGEQGRRAFHDPADFQRLMTSSWKDKPVLLVSEEMAKVAWEAAKTLQPQTLHAEDLPIPEGVALLGEYIPVRDARDASLKTAAIAWREITIEEGKRAGVWISYWADSLDPEDDVNKTFTRKELSVVPRLTPFHMLAWAFGKPFMTEEVQHSSIYGLVKKTLSLWLLCQQRVAVQSEVHPTRQLRRQAERAKMVVPTIKVVTLRRAYQPSENEQTTRTVDWTHRWLVNGFWRKQWYPSMQEHRQLWIAPYIKGPEHLPFVPKDDVYKLVR